MGAECLRAGCCGGNGRNGAEKPSAAFLNGCEKSGGGFCKGTNGTAAANGTDAGGERRFSGCASLNNYGTKQKTKIEKEE